MGYLKIEPKIKLTQDLTTETKERLDLYSVAYTDDGEALFKYEGLLGTSTITIDMSAGFASNDMNFLVVYNDDTTSHGGVVTVTYEVSSTEYTAKVGPKRFLIVNKPDPEDITIVSDTSKTPVKIYACGDGDEV
jgi:hypothetical protein